jgi:hypothetical protein
MGQKGTSAEVRGMSAYTSKADIRRTRQHGFVPFPDEVASHEIAGYSITLSARARNDSGTSSASAFAVLRLTTNSNLVSCSMGRSNRLGASQELDQHRTDQFLVHLSDTRSIAEKASTSITLRHLAHIARRGCTLHVGALTLGLLVLAHAVTWS